MKQTFTPTGFITRHSPGRAGFIRCLLSLLLLGGGISATAQIAAGTYLVGSSQPVYQKLVNVATALNTQGISGDVIFELDTDYDGTAGETFPITFTQFAGSNTFTVTIRPKAGAGMRTTSGSPASGASLVRFNGADRIILDGREGGTGTTISWTLRNTRSVTTIGPVVLFENDATNNQLQYLQLEGQNDGTWATVFFGSGPSTGNDDNIINGCDIRDRSDVAGTPAWGIYADGSTSNSNSGVSITNNNIYNYFFQGPNLLNPGFPSSAGIYLSQGNTGWTISGNSFYQTAARTVTVDGTNVAGIVVGDATALNMNIDGNFIGGSAASNGSTAWTMTTNSGLNSMTRGIYLGGGMGHTINNNNISNFDLTYSGLASATEIFSGVHLESGQASITNNTIGSTSANDAVKITMNSGSNVKQSIFGVNASDVGTNITGCSITGNNIGGFTIAGTNTTSTVHAWYGIYTVFSPAAATTIEVNNNLIGSTSLTNSVRATSTGMWISLFGVWESLSNPATVNINGNTVSGLTSSFSGSAVATGPTVYGIYMPGQVNATVDGNTVSDLYLNSLNTSGAILVTGIYGNNAAAAFTITDNTVRSLQLTNTGSFGSAATLNGILYAIAGSAGTGNTATVISRNKVWGLVTNNTGAVCNVSGIDTRSGCVVSNNQISLTNGSNTNNAQVLGIFSRGNGGTVTNVHHNTVYIGGTNGSGSNNSYAFSRVNTSTTVSIRNNVLVNDRTTSGIGGNYAIGNDLGGTSATGWSSSASNNNLFITANAAQMGRWAGSAQTLAQWQTSSGGDAQSKYFTAALVAPASLFTDKANGDLSIGTTFRKYVSGRAATGTGVTNDYNSTARSTTYPSIGAFEYPVGSWNGSISTDWAVSGNWDANSVPTLDDNVAIPVVANLPVISSGTAQAFDLQIASGASLTVNAGATLQAQGDITATGTLGGAGTVQMDGSLAQRISGTASIGRLTLNNTGGATIASGSSVSITGVLDVTAGTLTTNGGLTLKSTSAANTAMVYPVGGSITGNVNVERYVPVSGSSTGRSWRLIAAPVKGSSNNSIYFNWQHNGGANDGTGVEIWGPGGGNGLASGPAYSMRIYDPSTNTYQPVTNTQSTTLFDASVNKPFALFVTGPYGSGNIIPSSGAAATTLDATGSLITGTQNYSYTPSGSSNFSLIGNPFACPVDFDKIYSNGGTSNINRKFWVVDPNQSAVGNYVTIQYNIISGLYESNMISNQNQYIQNGQAFFVEATTPALATLAIEENDKETAAPQTGVFRTNGGLLETFRVNLVLPDTASPRILDGALVNCHQTLSSAINAAEDALKFANFNESISIQNGNTRLSIEGRPLYDNGDTLKIAMEGMQQLSYELQLVPGNINAPALAATLYDTYLNTSQAVSLTSNTTYAFTVTSNPSSAAVNRFLIVFHGNPLDIAFINLKAQKQNETVALQWEVAKEDGVQQYEVERSFNGNDYQAIELVKAEGSASYQAVDTRPGSRNYYRIRAVSRSGKAVYSPIAMVTMDGTQPGISLYPNPVEKNVNITLTGFVEGDYELAIYTLSGQEVRQQQVHMSAHSVHVASVDVASLASGSYMVVVKGQDGKPAGTAKLIKP